MVMYRIKCIVIVLLCSLSGCFSLNNEEKETYVQTGSSLGRDSWQKPELVIQALGDISAKTIVDIGAGTGYFTFRLAFKAKKVIAAEIDVNMIELMEIFKANLPNDIQERIEIRMVEPMDPKLSPEEADVVILINTITYIKNPIEYLQTLLKYLPDHGEIMIVDFKRKFIDVDAPPMAERLHSDTLVVWLEKAGFSKIEDFQNILDHQYIIKATKK